MVENIIRLLEEMDEEKDAVFLIQMYTMIKRHKSNNYKVLKYVK